MHCLHSYLPKKNLSILCHATLCSQTPTVIINTHTHIMRRTCYSSTFTLPTTFHTYSTHSPLSNLASPSTAPSQNYQYADAVANCHRKCHFLPADSGTACHTHFQHESSAAAAVASRIHLDASAVHVHGSMRAGIVRVRSLVRRRDWRFCGRRRRRNWHLHRLVGHNHGRRDEGWSCCRGSGGMRRDEGYIQGIEFRRKSFAKWRGCRRSRVWRGVRCGLLSHLGP